MAKLGISTGTFPNDGLGDSLLDGGIKINNNFDEIYTYFGDGTDLTFTTNGTITNLTGTAATITNFNSTNLVGAVLSVGGISTFTIGPVIIGTSSSTGTTLQPLQITGGAYISDNLGIGTTNPQSTLAVGGTITELYNGTYWNVVTQADVGIGTSQISLNQYLGQLAFLDAYAPVGLRSEGGSEYDIYVDSNGNVGVGTTNPTSALTIVGSGTSTSQLYVTEISRLGTVQISSGIVTALSGIVTYYGDISNAVSGRWTLDANGTSDYTFTGIGFTQTTNNPVLYLARGKVYEFVNNSGGSHPFEIRENDGGSAYSDGVANNGAATGVIRFEVPFNAPNTLYYQCTNHSGMGNTISVYPSTI